jgi:hypothetical protein
MNLGEWKSEVLSIVGRPTDTDLEARLPFYARLINKQIARTYLWPELYELNTTDMETTVDVPTVALPSETRTVLSLRVIDGSNSRKLIYRPPRRNDAIRPYPASDTTGFPRFYIPYSTNIELIPIPDATYAIYLRRYKWPAAVSDDADEFEFTDKDDLILQLGVMWVYLAVQEEGEAKIWASYASGSYKDALAKARETVDWDPSLYPADFATRGNPLPDNYWLNPMVW